MTKPVFDDEFKQGVVDYANQHPEESKVSIAKSFGIADSTIHKWIKDANKNGNKIESRGSGNFSSDEAMIQDIHAELRCNNQSKIINLFSHVTKLLGNINIFDFIIIDKHSRFSNKILKFCLEQKIR